MFRVFFLDKQLLIILILYYRFLSRRKKHFLNSLTVVSLVFLWLIFILLSSRKKVSLISICSSFYNLEIIFRISIVSTLWFQPSSLIPSFSHFFVQKLLSIYCIVYIVLIIPKPSVWLIDNIVNIFSRTIEKKETRLKIVIYSILDLTIA